uniref:hypothetical protein n=1 Tax=Falsiroseomonas oryziterrae TaxID=2911368 RepID=UPI001F2E94FA
MPILRALLLLLAVSAPWAIARAEAPRRVPPPLLETATVPGLGPNGQLELSRTLLRGLPRVFVIGPGGAFASRSGPAPRQELERLALEACQQLSRGRAPCTPSLRHLEIVWPGREWAPIPPPQGLAFS